MASAPKIKQFLASLKENFIDKDDLSFKDYYLALIRTELLQRGVVFEVEDPIKILEEVTKSAGKSLIESDTSTLPAPLMAGASAACGKLCEKLANLEKENNVFETKALNDAIRRCKDVEDKRLQIILELPQDKNFKESILFIAEGFFYRAATFQANAPMFKTAWDMILQRKAIVDASRVNNEIGAGWEATYAIQKLRDLIYEKGNKKRGSELTIRLVESLADHYGASSSDTTTVVSTFIQPFRPIKPSSVSRAANEGLALLNETSDLEGHLSESDQAAVVNLRFRLKVNLENDQIDSEAKVEHEKERNRVDRVKATPSIDQLKADIRRKHLGSLTPDSLSEEGNELKDLLLRGVNDAFRKQECSNLVVQYMTRLKEMAYSMGLRGAHKVASTAWQSLLKYSTPQLERRECVESTDEDWRKVLETSALSLTAVIWMASNPLRRAVSDADVQSATSVLGTGISIREAGISQSQEAGVVRSSLTDPERELLEFRSALFSLKTFTRLLESPFKHDPSERSLIESAVRTSSEEADIAESGYGGAFFACLLAWSGLYRTPWQSTTRAESRLLISKAKKMCRLAIKEYGRPESDVETLLLDLAFLSIESSFEDDRKLHEMHRKYTESKGIISRCELDTSSAVLLSSYVDANVAQLSGEKDDANVIFKRCIESLASIDSSATSFLLWTVDASRVARDAQIASTRLLLSHLLYATGKSKEADSILEAAVRDTPEDANALFTLGAFRLKMAFEESDPKQKSSAKTTLMKAAKADPTKADPFSLLGYFYEDSSDVARAKGCYSKALLLDPGNPIAGRGLLRLEKGESTVTTIRSAIESDSPFSGWAWIHIGLEKKQKGQDELASVSLLKGLRCTDIEKFSDYWLSPFFHSPENQSDDRLNEEVIALSHLAICYRRLGRFTASIQSYSTALEKCGDQTDAKLLIDCATVEAEMGLLESSLKKFRRAEKIAGSLEDIVLFGYATTLFLQAQHHLSLGKCGAGLADLKQASNLLQKCSASYACISKLLGDIHTSGSLIPTEIFESVDDRLAFIEKGEGFYLRAQGDMKTNDSESSQTLRASLATALGNHFLLRGQIQKDLNSKTIATDAFASSTTYFRQAISSEPTFAPAWAGLGCSLLEVDPILAQHALSRSIELDKISPEPLTILSLFYLEKAKYAEASETIDLLTQIADSPMVWLGRGLLLDIEAIGSKDAEARQNLLLKASDSYSASLQLSRTDDALLRQALSSRFSGRQQDCSLFLEEYYRRVERSSPLIDLLRDMLLFESNLEARRDSESLNDIRIRLTNDLAAINEQDWASIGLDKELLLKAFEAPGSSFTPSLSHLFEIPFEEANVSDQLLFHPDEASAWLEQAKEYLKSDSMSEARVLLSRSLSIFRSKQKRHCTNAADFADALALTHCLQTLGDDCNDEDENDTLLLQESLLMNPCNPHARNAVLS